MGTRHDPQTSDFPTSGVSRPDCFPLPVFNVTYVRRTPRCSVQAIAGSILEQALHAQVEKARISNDGTPIDPIDKIARSIKQIIPTFPHHHHHCHCVHHLHHHHRHHNHHHRHNHNHHHDHHRHRRHHQQHHHHHHYRHQLQHYHLNSITTHS